MPRAVPSRTSGRRASAPAHSGACRPDSRGYTRRMISRSDVDRLRERAPTRDSPVLSVYLDVDQSRAANRNREFESALRARLRVLEQPLDEPARAEFHADAAHVQRFVA